MRIAQFILKEVDKTESMAGSYILFYLELSLDLSGVGSLGRYIVALINSLINITI